MKTLSPYIHFNGSCEQALEFYKRTFEGQVTALRRYTDAPMPVPEAHKSKILHATFEAERIHFMASDSMPDRPAPTESMIRLSIDFTDTAEQDRVWARLADGGSVQMELQEAFWGARFGMVTDKFGIGWLLNAELPKKA